MIMLKFCFIGVGSIAKRHIRNLRAICNDRGIQVQIDAYRRTPSAIEGIDVVYSDIGIVPDDYDAVFITCPTDMHLEMLKCFHEKGRHFFIEKPAVSLDQLEEARGFRTKSGSVYHVACPLRYNAVIEWIKANVDPASVLSVRSISSSYLPDWRPGQDYRKTYSAHRDMGGGVSIDLIHEWDYLTYLFGWPERVSSMIGRKSDLEIDSDDYAIYIAEYSDKIAELHLDYFGRKTLREIELFTRDDTIRGDIANNRIHFLAQERDIDFRERRDDFQKRELQHFLDMILGVTTAEDGFCHGLDLLELTQGRV